MLLLNLIKLNLQTLTPVEQISSGDYIKLGSFCQYIGPSLSVIPLWRSCEFLCFGFLLAVVNCRWACVHSWFKELNC